MTTFDVYAKETRWVFISPHFDDAVLSCGGLISMLAGRGNPVEIMTVNAGIPEPGPGTELIDRIHAAWKTGTPEETILLRRNEDKNASLRTGAAVCHLSLVDAIYRRNKAGQYLYTEDVFDPIHEQEQEIVSQAALQISSNLQKEDMVICPLALGSHVDHVISRQAVESLGIQLLYYADIPYLFRNRDSLISAATAFQGIDIKLTKKNLAAWYGGISQYQSQISSLFANETDMVEQITGYWKLKRGITLWKKI